jgi:hypothetical protein
MFWATGAWISRIQGAVSQVTTLALASDAAHRKKIVNVAGKTIARRLVAPTSTSVQMRGGRSR